MQAKNNLVGDVRMDNLDTFVKPCVVVEQLNISYATLLRRVKKHEIPYIKIGSQLRFPLSYIQSLIPEGAMDVEVTHE